ncbi:hypothetical protein F4821DRAFT_232349 [Hypoxylon rubiginosum]|uniref:Uncharacterized protein n=1 Tax=Hypoxylon rubiginosum TaxID=110542 RepID=A0ACC0D8Z2_9PEZI|nr:hypothetical protein F4821DRAFT_232349 [Hypoxylon rubiginosum]
MRLCFANPLALAVAWACRSMPSLGVWPVAWPNSESKRCVKYTRAEHRCAVADKNFWETGFQGSEGVTTSTT